MLDVYVVGSREKLVIKLGAVVAEGYPLYVSMCLLGLADRFGTTEGESLILSLVGRKDGSLVK